VPLWASLVSRGKPWIWISKHACRHWSSPHKTGRRRGETRVGRSRIAEKAELAEMKTVTRRIDKLENRLGIAPGQPQILLVMCNAGWGLALEMDACVAILRECGFLPTSPGVSLADFGSLPEDLNAEELEKFLRENGAEICGARGVTSGR
jgi:hypothetical protein